MTARSPGRRAAAASLSCWLCLAGALLWASPARADDPGCPSAGDAIYIVKDGDTLSDLTRRFYSPGDDAQLHAAWEALHVYNKEAIGEDPNQFRHGSGTILCLRDRLSGRGWTLPRKGGGGALPLREAGPAPGVERKIDSKEETAPEPAGGRDAQRMDVYHHFDKAPTAEGPSRMEKALDSPPPRPNPLRRVVMGGMLGVMVPLSPALRDKLFREAGVALIDVRFTLGPVEIAPRAMFVGGHDSTVYNGWASPQTMLGGGAMLALGWPIELAAGRLGTARLVPGLESGLLWSWLHVEKMDPVRKGERKEDAMSMQLAGAFLRVEHTLGKASRWRAALDFAGDLLFGGIPGQDVSQRFTVNIFGGLGYALY